MEKAVAVRQFETEVFGDRLANVCEGSACAEIDAGLGRSSVNKQRNELARMVRTAKCRVVAVIRGEDQKIVISHCIEYLRKLRVEPFERFCVPFSISTVAVKHIEVDHVAKYKPRRIII